MRSMIYSLAAGLLLSGSICGLRADEKFQPPKITVPEGFTVEVAAAPPLVEHPMMAGFDDRGRLYIAESAGENLRRDDLEKQLPNFVRRLEDTDGDGVFDKSTIFADKLTFPQGALWHEGALYVAAPPNIWRFEDVDDDGVADKREIIVSAFGYTGNAADIHGCFLGPEGRLYWCDGRHGHEHAAEDGTIKSSGKAARIFSCLPDGSDFRVHCGGGMDNPVEIDFTEAGEMLGTVNLFYRTRGDCLVHWMHGGVYPRHDQEPVVAEFKRTGDLLPEVINLGHVAVSGTTRFRGGYFGEALRDNFFITEFNTHKVVRAILERDGATFRGRTEEFFAADSDDFHPTDVLQDADGSLLVIDTGGWFRIGCPTSQIAKPNILGAIYRVRRKGAETPADPRGQEIDWVGASSAELAALLGDERFAVREKAMARLSQRGDFAVRDLTRLGGNPSADARRNVIWTLARIASPTARDVLRRALNDRDVTVRLAAARSLGVLRDYPSVRPLVMQLTDENPALRREAATALGQIGAPEAAPYLLDALGADGVDRVLEHAVIYALIELDAPEATVDGLAAESPRVRRGALIALDQMEHGDLTREQVAPLLDTTDLDLQKTALEVIGRHPGWGDEIVALLTQFLSQSELPTDRQAMVRGALYAFRADEKIQTLIADRLASNKATPAVQQLLLQTIARSGLKPLPEAWTKAVAGVLRSAQGDVLLDAVAAAASSDDGAFRGQLLAIADDDQRDLDLRIAALGAVAERGSPLSAKQFELLTAQLNDAAPPMRRLAAARALGAANLNDEQLVALADRVAKSGPLEFAPLLGAFEKTVSPLGGKRLVTALVKSPAAEGLTETQLVRLLEPYPDDVKRAAAPLVERLRAATAQQRQRLDEILPQTADGDAKLGHDVFFGKKTSCYACHRVGQEGGAIGPDLSTIGQRRNRRDLLEAVLYPSASLARGFESYTISTDSGRIHTGLIVRETADILELRTQQQQELRLRRSEVEAMKPSPTSIMPAGLDKTMTVDQLRDLLAYLESLR